jgi:hypothetical protein
MAERLVKIAKELNVGLATIVDFLASKGTYYRKQAYIYDLG